MFNLENHAHVLNIIYFKLAGVFVSAITHTCETILPASDFLCDVQTHGSFQSTQPF
jgi:hypothetical protein